MLMTICKKSLNGIDFVGHLLKKLLTVGTDYRSRCSFLGIFVFLPSLALLSQI